MQHIGKIALLTGMLLHITFSLPIVAHSRCFTLLHLNSTQSKTQDEDAYKAWYDAYYIAKDDAKAEELANKYIEKFPNGKYSEFIRTWLRNIPVYYRPQSSNRVFKTTRGSFGVWVNPTKWTLSKEKTGRDVEFRFIHISGKGNAVVISNKTSLPMASLKNLVYDNAKKAAPDARIVEEEKRIVNGREILCLTIESMKEGKPSTSYGYYYSGEEGTIHVETMTGQYLFSEYQEDFTDLLNGLAVIAPELPNPPPPGVPFKGRKR